MRSTPKPNLVIAGVHKAGTTSLFRYLSQHDEICIAGAKTQARYFSPLRRGEGTLEPIEEFSKRHFAHCGERRYRMEASSNYLFGGDRLVDAIATSLDDPRIIVSLRDPVTRMWSFFNYMKSMFSIPKEMSFGEYLLVARDLRAKGDDDAYENRAFGAYPSGFYCSHIEPWLETFGERVRVVFFENLVRDPGAVVKDICDWLEISSEPVTRFDYSPANVTVRQKSKLLRRSAFFINRHGQRLLPKRVKPLLNELYYRINSEAVAEKLPDALRAELEDEYAPSNRQLAILLRSYGYSDLPKWLTDDKGEPQLRDVVPAPSRT